LTHTADFYKSKKRILKPVQQTDHSSGVMTQKFMQRIMWNRLVCVGKSRAHTGSIKRFIKLFTGCTSLSPYSPHYVMFLLVFQCWRSRTVRVHESHLTLIL